MSKKYEIVGKKERKKLKELLAGKEEIFLPVMRLIENSQVAVDGLIGAVGRTVIETVLQLSAREVAGTRQQGRGREGDILWHGSQDGKVRLSDRKIRVRKPRLRRRGGGRGSEVEIPAYEAMRTHPGLGPRMLDVLMRGVSTRNYGNVITEMAGSVGVSKSSVSRELVVASEEELKKLLDRRFDDVDLMVIYIDGIQYGDMHVIVAIGVDSAGDKHVLRLKKGCSENGDVVRDLLNELVEHGVKRGRKRLFVIDGSKALRSGIDAAFGTDNLVQRCRKHKLRNVLGNLPQEDRDQVEATMKSAYKLKSKEGMARLEKLAQWLEKTNTEAAGSLREGLKEMFTINDMDITDTLRRCLGNTNVIESPYSGVRSQTNRVKKWKDDAMLKRWVAACLLAGEKRYNKIMGYKDLWMLQAELDRKKVDERKEVA